VAGPVLSGHGFESGPLTGRFLAEQALDGRPSVVPFEAERPRFAYTNVRT
jgi:glycine/D-amino acid oxidase-like deaminating enzyme